MNIFKEYMAYLKDNPEGYWFKRKIYGWGWTPARWQGWVVILVYVLILWKLFFIFGVMNPNATSSTLIDVAPPLILITALLIYICYKKGEKPRWQWGFKK